MAKVFLAISILLLIGAAGLGFVTKGKVEQKVADLKAMTSKYEDTDKKLTTTKGQLASTKEELEASTKTVAEQKTQISDLDAKVAAAKADVDKATADAAEKVTLLASVQKDYDEYKTKHPEGGNNPTGPAGPTQEALQAELDSTKKALAEANVVKEQAQARQKAADESQAGLLARIAHYEKPIQMKALTGRVVSINPGWNFVVLDIGDKQGVTVNSPLLVVRDGQRVANLKITSVEPRTSIADIVPGSVARGGYLQAGDRVVFAGDRGNAPLAPLPPAGSSGPSEAATAPANALPQ